jgi:hypothetical protein
MTAGRGTSSAWTTRMTKLHKILPLMMSAATAGLTGCIVAPEPAVAEAGVAESGGYSPLYYDGYVVYYSDGGHPYYYVAGRPYWVPRTYVHYHGLVRHYHVHRHVYRGWYVRWGHSYRYHRYRR